jgi:hypothetical protein
MPTIERLTGERSFADWEQDPDGVIHAPGTFGGAFNFHRFAADGLFAIKYGSMAGWEQAITLYMDEDAGLQTRLNVQLGTFRRPSILIIKNAKANAWLGLGAWHKKGTAHDPHVGWSASQYKTPSPIMVGETAVCAWEDGGDGDYNDSVAMIYRADRVWAVHFNRPTTVTGGAHSGGSGPWFNQDGDPDPNACSGYCVSVEVTPGGRHSTVFFGSWEDAIAMARTAVASDPATTFVIDQEFTPSSAVAVL